MVGFSATRQYQFSSFPFLLSSPFLLIIFLRILSFLCFFLFLVLCHRKVRFAVDLWGVEVQTHWPYLRMSHWTLHSPLSFPSPSSAMHTSWASSAPARHSILVPLSHSTTTHLFALTSTTVPKFPSPPSWSPHFQSGPRTTRASISVEWRAPPAFTTEKERRHNPLELSKIYRFWKVCWTCTDKSWLVQLVQ